MLAAASSSAISSTFNRLWAQSATMGGRIARLAVARFIWAAGFGTLGDGREGQGSALDPLGPWAPDPILSVPRLASTVRQWANPKVLREGYRRFPSRSAK